MIRLKNNVLPVWFQWDGDETSLERAKQTIIEDIRQHGFDHYTGYADIMDEPADDEKGWDGADTIDVTLTPPTTKKANTTDVGEGVKPPKKSKVAPAPKGAVPNLKDRSDKNFTNLAEGTPTKTAS